MFLELFHGKRVLSFEFVLLFVQQLKSQFVVLGVYDHSSHGHDVDNHQQTHIPNHRIIFDSIRDRKVLVHGQHTGKDKSHEETPDQHNILAFEVVGSHDCYHQQVDQLNTAEHFQGIGDLVHSDDNYTHEEVVNSEK